jgi:hypothetical protein
MRLLTLILLFGLLYAPTVTADPPEPTAATEEKQDVDVNKQPTSFWMQKKLEYSQSVLRGLAEGDFEAIKMSSGQLRTLSKVEGFVRRKNPEYRAQLHTFERVCDEMGRYAERENLEGVNLAFNQLTMSCVTCHQLLRATPVEPANDEQ